MFGFVFKEPLQRDQRFKVFKMEVLKLGVLEPHGVQAVAWRSSKNVNKSLSLFLFLSLYVEQGRSKTNLINQTNNYYHSQGI